MDGTSNEIGATGSLPSAPPPPPEVKVRTMRSDIESMAKSGGGMPKFQNVQVSGLTMAKAQRGAANPEKKGALITAIVVLIALAIVIGGIYFAYLRFFGAPA